MKTISLITTLIISATFAFSLSGCSQPAEETPAAATATATETAPASPAPTAGGGGYEPSADERVPGITMSQEELDKLYAEAKADIPTVTVPGEAKPE